VSALRIQRILIAEKFETLAWEILSIYPPVEKTESGDRKKSAAVDRVTKVNSENDTKYT
jgi:hypothetical protein